jgi:methionyl-tRNA formyltransferase
MRIIFCGTPEFGLPTFRALLADSDFQIDAVVTPPDRPHGRGQEVSAPVLKKAAENAGVAVFQPEKIKSDAALEFFQRAAPDAVVIIAYGQIIPKRLIEIPRLGWINLHASLLPKYRGAAPINWAIVNGETVSGLTTMQIDAGMDTGPILLQHKLKIGPDETSPQLAEQMSEAGASLMIDSLRKLDAGEIAPRPQNASHASIAPKLEKEHGRIDWSLTAQQIYNRIRGLAPWPGAYTTFRGKLCHIWGHVSKSATASTSMGPGTIFAGGGSVYVVCGDGSCLNLEAAHIEGRKRISAREFVSGARLESGERFGENLGDNPEEKSAES